MTNTLGSLPAKNDSTEQSREMGIIIYHGMLPKNVSYTLLEKKDMDWVLYGQPHKNNESAAIQDADHITERSFQVTGQGFCSLHSLLEYVFKNNIRVTNEYTISIQ